MNLCEKVQKSAYSAIFFIHGLTKFHCTVVGKERESDGPSSFAHGKFLPDRNLLLNQKPTVTSASATGLVVVLAGRS